MKHIIVPNFIATNLSNAQRSFKRYLFEEKIKEINRFIFLCVQSKGLHVKDSFLDNLDSTTDYMEDEYGKRLYGGPRVLVMSRNMIFDNTNENLEFTLMIHPLTKEVTTYMERLQYISSKNSRMIELINIVLTLPKDDKLRTLMEEYLHLYNEKVVTSLTANAIENKCKSLNSNNDVITKSTKQDSTYTLNFEVRKIRAATVLGSTSTLKGVLEHNGSESYVQPVNDLPLGLCLYDRRYYTRVLESVGYSSLFGERMSNGEITLNQRVTIVKQSKNYVWIVCSDNPIKSSLLKKEDIKSLGYFDVVSNNSNYVKNDKLLKRTQNEFHIFERVIENNFRSIEDRKIIKFDNDYFVSFKLDKESFFSKVDRVASLPTPPKTTFNYQQEFTTVKSKFSRINIHSDIRHQEANEWRIN